MKIRNAVVIDLIVGLLIYAVIVETLILCFLDNKLYISSGFILGIILAIYSAIKISLSVEISLRMDKDSAVKYTKKKYLLRMLLFAGVLVLLLLVKIGNPLALIVGLFGLKIAAYGQPFVHKITSKLSGKKEGD